MKYIAAVLAGPRFGAGEDLVRGLERILGRIDYMGPARPFTVSDYYEDEMGPDLGRAFYSFELLGPPERIAAIKHETSRLEDRLSADGRRNVNIDAGYMDYFKVVLASFKAGPQKIYLGDGVYADPVMMYRDGAFEPLPWTFPDIREGGYTEDFIEIRRLYKQARKPGWPGGRSPARPGGV